MPAGTQRLTTRRPSGLSSGGRTDLVCPGSTPTRGGGRHGTRIPAPPALSPLFRGRWQLGDRGQPPSNISDQDPPLGKTFSWGRRVLGALVRRQAVPRGARRGQGAGGPREQAVQLGLQVVPHLAHLRGCGERGGAQVSGGTSTTQLFTCVAAPGLPSPSLRGRPALHRQSPREGGPKTRGAGGQSRSRTQG